MKTIPCSLYRGGTSKGVLFHARDLPQDRDTLRKILLKVMGSPDSRQIDGLGGADPLTSRVGIVSQDKEGCIQFQFAFVHIAEAIVDYEGFCGNLLSAAALFAIEEELVAPDKPFEIFDTNTQMLISAEVSSDIPKPIAGVPQTGSRVALHFHNPPVSLQTGNICDRIEGIDVSLINCLDPVIFLKADSLGFTGQETPSDMKPQDLKKLEELRLECAKAMGIFPSGSLPKIAFVAKHSNPGTLYARMMAVQKMHKAYAVSCGICTAAAALIPGSIVNQCFKKEGDRMTIVHPEGEMELFIEGDTEKITVERTARCLMKGSVSID